MYQLTIEHSTRFILRKIVANNTTWLWGQVSVIVPKLGTILPPSIPNWLTSSLKPRAWLYMEVATDHNNQWPRVDINNLAWDDLDTLLIQVDKENSMKFLLNFLHYLYNYYMVCALSSYTPMWPGHVTSPDCDLWHLVMWYFLTLHSCVVSPEKKYK